ncbi:MAG: hypothetical protein A3F83_10790 [Candidatus Glassbacteria bacterium RIFCSPLOWO2_12_FULL_58_11]|uniref:FlgD Ig-like domain-containing protein n=1 Tax=Candidatus Glassbacteria bacterium RIFCSPLOWO2_12_FULL_58_11 TaxID=1817867 RepID=A0A1F5Z091_9BACT|nr:MAG: hypothetical protein A3F83_10790 [Candidatus Glassbacteria bacterium RIFCSPLOWO2_12_FULL_58_11]
MVPKISNKLYYLILVLLLCGISPRTLPVREALAGEPQGSRNTLSPQHGSLLRILRAQAAASEKIEALNRKTVKAAPQNKQVKKIKAAAPAASAASVQKSQPSRAYLAPNGKQRSLLLEGLARELRTSRVSADGQGPRILQEINRLSGLSRQGGTSLASAGFDVGEPNSSEIEPNDTWDAAQAIEYGAMVAAGSTPQSDVDVYSFQGKAGDFVRIEALPTDNNNGWTVTQLFDADTNLISGGYYGLKEADLSDSRIISPIIWPGGSLIGASLPKDGTYYIQITSYPGGIIFLDAGTGAEGVDEDASAISYTLSLQNLPTLPVNGRVADDAGGAVAGATLYIWSNDGIGGVQAETDKSGAFSLSLPQGSYSASIKSPAGSRYPDDQIYDNFEVGEKGADLTYTLKSGVIFSGVTVDDRGAAAPFTGFSLIDYESGQYRWGYSDEQGAFSVALFPGTYEIYLSAPYYFPPQPVIRGVRIDGDTDYKIVLDSGNRVSGALLAPDGHPLSGVGLTFYGGQDSRWAYTDTAGRYEVALLEGDYWIDVRFYGAYLLPDQSVGPLTVSGDLDYDIRLAAGGIITGSVIDSRGKPVSWAQINLWPTYPQDYSGETDPGKTDPSDPDGVAGSDSVASGGSGAEDEAVDSKRSPYYYYQAFTSWSDAEGNWQAALLPGEYTVEVIAPWDYPSQQTKSGTWNLAEGDRLETPQVTIEAGIMFSGRLVRPDGSPQPWGSFMMQTASSGAEDSAYISPDGMVKYQDYPEYAWWSRYVYTDENGAFSVRVFPGTYDLYFDGRYEKGGYPSQKMTGVTLSSDLDLTLSLQAGFRLSGRTVDPLGHGIEGSYLSFYGDDGSWQGAVSSGRDGSFEIQMMAGLYGVLISPAADYFPDSSKISLEITGDQSLEVVLRPGVKISGQVTGGNGKALPGVMLHLIPNYSGQDSVITILPVDPDMPMRGLALAGAVGLVQETLPDPVRADGQEAAAQNSNTDAFAPESGAPAYRSDMYGGKTSFIPWWGDYDFYAWTDDNGNWGVVVKANIYDIYVEPNTKDYNGVFLQGIDCTQDRRLDITLPEAEVKVDGTVEDKDGQMVPGALISLMNTRTGGQISVTSDAAGRFTVNAAPGDYELYAGLADNSSGAPVTANVSLEGDSEMRIKLGSGLLDTDSKDQGPNLPRAFALAQNTPNPFNPSTTISYTVGAPAHVRLTVYDLRGRLVSTLADKQVEAGTYYIQWNGSDSKGNQLASGVYFYRLESGSFTDTRKMVLLK